MPDNNNNWSADETFWDEAWNDMQGQLEAAMPTRKKRRRGILLWWVTGMAALLLIGTTVYRNWENEASLTTNTVVFEDESAQASGIDTDRIAATDIDNSTDKEEDSQDASPISSSDQQIASSHSPLAKQLTASKPETTKFQLQTRPARRQAGRGSKADKYRSANTPERPENDVTIPAATTALPENTSPSATLPASLPTTPNFRNTRLAPTPPLQQKIHLLALDRTQPNLTNLPLSPAQGPGFSRTDILVEVIGSRGSKSPGTGYGFGLVLQRQLDTKNAVYTSIGLRAQRESFQVSTPGNSSRDESASPVVINQDSMAIGTLSELSQVNDLLAENNRNYITTYDLRLGLGYQRNFGRRFSIAGEAGLNYLLRGRAPSLLGYLDQNGQFNENAIENFIITDNSLNLNYDLASAGFANSFTQAATGESTGVIADRLRFDLGVKLGYRIGSRWQVNLGFRSFLRPVINSDFVQINTIRGEVGVRYRF